MKIVVITGSSRGIGYGLAKQFLALGCSVVINGRDSNKLEQARQILANEYDTDRILAFSCDVSNFVELQALWDKAITNFGKVDIWINNAGTIHKRYPVWQQTPEQIKSVIETNLLGTEYD
ncbi:MAG: SDR family oxidoreductase [Moorea sp. SIO2B7]|nr:SDR family oxidoreductase [Moorena sp. SIO2B7]